jgi:hypothetical protein
MPRSTRSNRKTHSSMTDYSKLYHMRIIKPGTSLAMTEKIDSVCCYSTVSTSNLSHRESRPNSKVTSLKLKKLSRYRPGQAVGVPGG